MNLHPALLAVLIVDLLAVTLLAVALVGAVRVVIGWHDGAPTRAQLSLERTSEEVSSFARLGLGLLAAGGVLLVIVVNHVLPALVPGAMCGVGALQAMPGGKLALAVRGLSIGALWVWWVIDALDRSAPLAPLATRSARALLVSAPIAFVAAWQTGEGLLHVDLQHPVSCCAAVYDLAAVGAAPGAGPHVAGPWHVAVAGAGLVMLVAAAAAFASKARGRLPARWSVGAWSVLGLVWTAWAAWVLVDVAGPYLYGVLGHRCPLCFFLPHHLGVGYPLFGALLVVVAGCLAAATSVFTGTGNPQVEAQARRFTRRASTSVTAAALLFSLLAAGPALWWRVEYGVWIGG